MRLRHRSTALIILSALLILALAATAVAQTVTPTPTPTVVPETEEVDEPADIEVDEDEDEEIEELLVEQEPAEEDLMAEEAGRLELTVYGQDLGLIKQVRSVDLAAGLNEIRLIDVPRQIRPSSVHVVSLTDPDLITLLEQSFEFDIVSTNRLLQRHVDETISLVTADGQTLTGTLLSAENDVILATNDELRIIRNDHIQEFVLPAPPDELITRPTLVWLIDALEEGSQDLSVTYLTGGISWQADYVAMLNPDDTELSLTSWVSLTNNSGASYQEAKLKLIAGDISTVRAEEPMVRAEMMVMAEAAPDLVEEREFFDYHLYEVTRPVTVRDRQTKQIEFLQADDVVVAREYTFEATPPIFVRLGRAITDRGYGVQEQAPIEVRINLTNDEESGLGIPLPRGVIRVYKEDIDGSAILVGEDRINHTPRNETVSLTLGQAFDLVGERAQIAFRQLGERAIEETIEIRLRNQSDEAVTIRVVEHLFRAHDADVIESTVDFEQVDANTIEYLIEVEPGEAETITYTVVYRW